MEVGFMKSSSRRLALLITAGLFAGLTIVGLVGCGGGEVEKEQQIPYVHATVTQIMTGAVRDTVGRAFNFEIDAPTFEYVRGNVGIVRDGNRLEFLVADNLEKRQHELKGCLLGVKMAFAPGPAHLILQRISRDGVVLADSLPRPASYPLPKVLRAAAVDLRTPGAALPEIKWNRAETIEPFLPKNEGDALIPIQSAVEKLVRAPRHDLPQANRAAVTDKDMAWYAVFPDATVQIVEVTPGADYMLQLLVDQRLPLVGSFSMKTFDRDFLTRKTDYRGIGRVVGTMKINWFRYANTFIAGN
jgi:hypothetical protein